MNQWIVAGIGGETDTWDRDREFSTKGGLTREQLAGRIRKTMDRTSEVMQPVSPQRLTETINSQTGPVSVLEAIYHVVGHFQLHVGQIVFITESRIGEDLGLTRLSLRAK
jgi:hypothetical protein